MKIIWSPLAVAKVRQETQYIARDRSGAAANWAEGIFDAVARLTDLPESGRVVPELGRSDVREITYRSHRVIYRIEERSILILTVRHWRQLLDLSELGDVQK
ncbi:MAG TPA: type II toxin-antitoxin system RelE/ParE family toxin [Thermoanaerobaculia bacterium]|nr:type II toxin-antitoxin system RelE/ParE family toxin [Thermoanaerobaculia bacterium]